MLKSGVPKPAVAHKMAMEGHDAGLLDLDPNAPAPAALLLKDDPKYAKFFRMLKSGVPKPAVAHKMTSEGLDPAALDADRNKPFAPAARGAAGGGGGGVGRAPLKKEAAKRPSKPRLKRKKLHWKAIGEDEIAEDSIWGRELFGGEDAPLSLEGFDDLFIQRQTSGGAASKAPRGGSGGSAGAKRPAANVIDARRAQNVGIAIARIKLSYADMREHVAHLRDHKFTTVQMRTLQTFLPSAEEKAALGAYAGDRAALNEAEKFMLEMSALEEGGLRLEAMVFKANFREKMHELRSDVALVEEACDDIKMSLRLRKVLHLILRIGNEMNEGKAAAFSLDALGKLSVSKAFDKKTTVLDYLVTVLTKQDPDLLDLGDDLRCCARASRVMLDALRGELRVQRAGLETFRRFVPQMERLAVEKGIGEAPPLPSSPDVPSLRKGEAGLARSQSAKDLGKLEELRSQRSELRTDASNVKHYNSAESEKDRQQRLRREAEEAEDRRRAEAARAAAMAMRSAAGQFSKRAEHVLDAADREMERMANKFGNVLSYFGENSSRSSHEFFSLLNNFVRDFELSRQRVERQQRSAARAKRIEKAKLRRATSMAAKTVDAEERSKLSIDDHAKAAAQEYAKAAQAKSGAKGAGEPKGLPPRRRSIFF